MKSKIHVLSMLSVLFFGIFAGFGHVHDNSGHFHLKTRGSRKPHHGSHQRPH
jgi:hypothetical protein